LIDTATNSNPSSVAEAAVTAKPKLTQMAGASQVTLGGL
jgi:hypothetical protein